MGVKKYVISPSFQVVCDSEITITMVPDIVFVFEKSFWLALAFLPIFNVNKFKLANGVIQTTLENLKGLRSRWIAIFICL